MPAPPPNPGRSRAVSALGLVTFVAGGACVPPMLYFLIMSFWMSAQSKKYLDLSTLGEVFGGLVFAAYFLFYGSLGLLAGLWLLVRSRSGYFAGLAAGGVGGLTGLFFMGVAFWGVTAFDITTFLPALPLLGYSAWAFVVLLNPRHRAEFALLPGRGGIGPTERGAQAATGTDSTRAGEG